MPKYKNDYVQPNGSLRVKSTGAIDFQGAGLGGDNNQVATYNEAYGIGSTNLGDLLEQFITDYSVCQVSDKEPKERPEGDNLEPGDLWVKDGDRTLFFYTGNEWLPIRTDSPVGTIITTIITDPVASPPSGYLKCDGTECPAQYEDLRELLFENNGDFELPNRPNGDFIKF